MPLALLIALLAPVSAACPVDRPQADAAAERARVALRAAPDRPGLRLAFGERLLIADDPEGAAACAADVIARWPGAVRARLLLARVALARGDAAGGRALLDAVAADGPRVAADEARRLLSALGPAPAPPPAAAEWGGRLALGGYHDTRAATLDPVPVEPLPADADPAAWRLAFTGEGYWQRRTEDGALRVRAGLDRTLHFADAAVEPGRLDHTALWIDGHREHRLGGEHRAGLGVELRGTLAGRLGEPHHLGLGLVGWWRRAGPAGGPWARLRVFGFAFDEAAARDTAAELWSELAVGGQWRRGPFTVDGRLGGQWVGPGDRAFAGLAADLRPGVDIGWGGLYLLGGLGWRRASWGDALVPRLGGGAHLALGQRGKVSVDAIWQQARRTDGPADRVERFVGGTTLEVWF